MDLQRLGRYEILNELGRGAFATVFRARDTILGREVALKVLHPSLMADPAFVRRFENDARAAAQLDHPHIVAIHDFGQAEGRLYIVMPLLPGGNLADRLAREGRLSFSEAVRIVAQVADALEYAHDKGFIHRDVKPTNVLFNARGEAVLADFGLVAAVENSVIAQSSTGGVVGTPAYIPPEVWEGKAAGPQADVYALACVCYEMLTGEVLFQGDTSPAVMRAHFLPPSFPAAWPEGTPPGLAKVLARALSQEPGRRYETPDALVVALQTLEEKSEETPAFTSPDTPNSRSPHWKWLIALGASGLIGIFLWIIFRPWSPLPAQTPTLPAPLTPPVTHTFTPPATVEPAITATLTFTPPPRAFPTLVTSPTTLSPPTPVTSPTTPSPQTPEAIAPPTQVRATATPRPTATVKPLIPPAPRLISPPSDLEISSPIRFRWQGTLYPGQYYIVSAYSTRTGYSLQSPALTAAGWDVNLPGETYGEWKWTIKVLQGSEVLCSSVEGKFWFNPFPSPIPTPTEFPSSPTPTPEEPFPSPPSTSEPSTPPPRP